MANIKLIRTKLFGMYQSEFAKVCGISQSAVCRMEDGNPPDSNRLRGIRDEAIRRGYAWNDSIFFMDEKEAEAEIDRMLADFERRNEGSLEA